jgi:hypothetical protein
VVSDSFPFRIPYSLFPIPYSRACERISARPGWE